MARGVDEIEGIALAVFALVREGDGLALDGNAPLPFDIHVVQDLVLEGADIGHAGILNQPVGEG